MPTTIMPRLGSILILSMLSLVACDAMQVPEGPDALPQAIDFRTGPEGPWPPPGGGLNTAWLGDTPLMRILPPGYLHILRGLDVRATQIQVQIAGQYHTVTSVSAVEGTLILETAVGTHKGAELVGSRWWLDQGHTEYITITEVAEGGQAPGYQLAYKAKDGEGMGTVPICEPDIDGDHWAYLVGDVYVDVDDATITQDTGALLVACSSGALGKAITWGFAPWVHDDEPLPGVGEPPPLDLPLYQTGVRTVRADYCGDGEAHTEDGTRIQVRNDLIGLAFDSSQQSTEAVFGPDGALCLSSPRDPGAVVDCALPTCPPFAWTLMTAHYHAWTKLAPP
ncbi:ADYC domain-containing protein [Paraliomyxa miuraensis]|uniref:ADYC domain-containing protein n=1 Tax=Paraliomyxa miuraensis TaxID=376150 RepID=UPI0022544533|nr:ADYC domain-containing protein [Paraliomyxa miuraensis]MCX4243271.1 ADYC domain-containing protein [Paraliomyxa miuraensis]